MSASPFHSGELAVQERLGVRAGIDPWARKVVKPTLPEQHRAFYAQLPYLVLAARDDAGRPWATLLAGEPGFARSPDPGQLEIAVRPGAGDALANALEPGSDLGLLGIELHSRRRNRVNGRVAGLSAKGITLGVEQAFGNCPQYIHERTWTRAPETKSATAPRRSNTLSDRMRHQIEHADTFFIATGHRAEGESVTFGMDASHRGGDPGFVRATDGQTLWFPDYAGNNHFNTLGNLSLDPRAGLLFVDFERGNLLQLTGRAFIEWDHPDVALYPGARRLMRFELDEALEQEGVLPIRFAAAGEGVRSLRLVDKVNESDDVTSFVFESRDGGTLPDFAAGQHLPLEVEVEPGSPPMRRTYSLSNAPSEGVYRISVKREFQGAVSRQLHDHVDVGAIVNVRAPAGDFTLDHEGTRPIVLLSAGVGVTPMASMLHELAGGDSVHRARDVYFVHGARDGAHHPLGGEVSRVVREGDHPRLHVHVAYSQPRAEDDHGRDYDSRGRVDADLLERILPSLDADYYVCGPNAFMAALQQQLEDRGVPAEQIRSESFGPTG